MGDDSWFFAGRTALVTGGASGMGRAVVTQLLRMGTRVVSADVADQDDGPSRLFRPVRVDVADAGALDRLFAEELADGVDLVVNAAGVSPLRETLERVVGVDLLAVRRVCALALARMGEDGAVVNVASVAGVYEAHDEVARALLDAPDDDAALDLARRRIGQPGLAYAVAKRAVILLTMRLAGQVAARRIRVNATSPHAAATPMHYAIKHGEPEMYARAKMTATWGRWSSADEQADAIVYLLGPRSSYVSGQNLLVDGGWHAAMRETDPDLRQY